MSVKGLFHFYWIYFQIRFLLWLVKVLKVACKATGNRVVIVPADPVSVVGSKGDEAMYSALLSKLTDRGSGLIVDVFVSKSFIAFPSGGQVVNPIPLWGGGFFVINLYRYFLSTAPKAIYVIGADVMDGSYSPVNSLRMMVAAELAAALKIDSIVTGFSFNPRCPKRLQMAYSCLAKQAKYNVRDPISHGIFSSLVPHARKVADMAFLVKPTATSKATNEAEEWVLDQKTKSRLVVGVNFHPMLFIQGEKDPQYSIFFDSLLKVLRVLVVEHGVSVLLVPHDDRAFAGDISALSALYSRLENEGVANHVHYLGLPPSAGDLKMIASYLDLVITGRMHFCIAALGVTVPVVAFAYQAKFLGLFSLFDYPKKFVVDPKVVREIDLLNVFSEAISERSRLKALLESNIDSIKRMSLQNFE